MALHVNIQHAILYIYMWYICNQTVFKQLEHVLIVLSNICYQLVPKLVLYCWKLWNDARFSMSYGLWCFSQHLVQWDTGNSECLLQLVKELLQQYHNYQCERLRESSRLLFEYDSLLEDPSYGRNMEIYAGKKNSWVSEWLAFWQQFWKFLEILCIAHVTKNDVSFLVTDWPVSTVNKQQFLKYIVRYTILP